ncbi:Uncharacterized protein TCM_018907 [Theobroma cacao]|uniref:RNase H type-1 domain-containing protein n=1 Tax=Theobroma cacao TaxID=3641 RepID=A0A061EN63_THECC|nr:Uncharacterized protein TCM_018907 [Theobroma cacao]
MNDRLVWVLDKKGKFSIKRFFMAINNFHEQAEQEVEGIIQSWDNYGFGGGIKSHGWARYLGWVLLGFLQNLQSLSSTWMTLHVVNQVWLDMSGSFETQTSMQMECVMVPWAYSITHANAKVMTIFDVIKLFATISWVSANRLIVEFDSRITLSWVKETKLCPLNLWRTFSELDNICTDIGDISFFHIFREDKILTDSLARFG